MTAPSDRQEEDHLDWLENCARAPGEARRADVLIAAACVGLGSAVVAGLWLIRR